MTFVEALKNKDLEALKKYDKTDYHNHCGLGMRFDAFEEYCGVALEKPPKKMNGLDGLDDYMFRVTRQYVLHREGFEFSVNATIQDAIKDGVKILVTSIDIGNMSYYDTNELYFDFLNEMKEQYKNEIEFKPEIGVFKGVSDEYFDTHIKACIQSGVFYSIDFYGTETIINLPFFKTCMTEAKAFGLITKIHIGEFCTDEEMAELIDQLDLDEIQHGIQCYKSQALMDRVKEKDIILHVCPSSNVALGAVESFDKHPIKTLVENGIKVTINTDDLLFFDSSVSEEFLKLYEHNVLTAEQLDQIRTDSLNYIRR